MESPLSAEAVMKEEFASWAAVWLSGTFGFLAKKFVEHDIRVGHCGEWQGMDYDLIISGLARFATRAYRLRTSAPEINRPLWSESGVILAGSQ